MKRSLMISFCVFMAFIVNMPVRAALDLELTQGIAAALPIAIVPFAGGSNNVPGKTTISHVISQDLQNSGQFRVVAVPPSNGVSALGKIDAQYWRKQGVNDVVVGQVDSQGFGRYKIQFKLLNIYGDADAGSGKNNVLLTESFHTDTAGLRHLSHHISDIIYQKLTGVRGIFSTKIAYILLNQSPQMTRYSLVVADEDGFGPQSLLQSYQPIMSPAWSPNGQKIAYVSFENGRAAIFVQDLIKGTRQRVSDFPGINGAPAFSPDGRQLALVLTKTGNPKIYTLDLSSGKLVQLTHGYSIDTEPSWAPDGKSLIFTSNRGGTPQIYQYQMSSKKVQRITFDGNYNAKASYLPKDQGIVMMHRSGGMFGIASQSLISGRVKVLTQTGGEESPSLAPNGKMVVYATSYGTRKVLGMVSTDGRVKLRLPSSRGLVQGPAWSPF